MFLGARGFLEGKVGAGLLGFVEFMSGPPAPAFANLSYRLPI